MIPRTLELDIWSDTNPPIRMSTSSVEMPEGEEGSWGLDEIEEASSYLVLTLRLQLNLVRYFPFRNQTYSYCKRKSSNHTLLITSSPPGFVLSVGRVCTKVLSAPSTTSSPPPALSTRRGARPPWRSSFIRSRNKIRRMETGLTKSVRKRAETKAKKMGSLPRSS